MWRSDQFSDGQAFSDFLRCRGCPCRATSPGSARSLPFPVLVDPAPRASARPNRARLALGWFRARRLRHLLFYCGAATEMPAEASAGPSAAAPVCRISRPPLPLLREKDVVASGRRAAGRAAGVRIHAF